MGGSGCPLALVGLGRHFNGGDDVGIIFTGDIDVWGPGKGGGRDWFAEPTQGDDDDLDTLPDPKPPAGLTLADMADENSASGIKDRASNDPLVLLVVSWQNLPGTIILPWLPPS